MDPHGSDPSQLLSAKVFETPFSFSPERLGLWAGLVALLALLLKAAAPLLDLLRRGATNAVASLYSRVSHADALNHPVRNSIHALVEADPGLHFQEIVRRLKLPPNTVYHHLKKLVQLGLLTEHVGKGYNCYFPKGTVDRRVMAALPVLKSTAAREILSALARPGGITPRQVAQLISLTPTAVHYHLRRLTEAGLALANPSNVETWTATEVGLLALRWLQGT